MLLRAPGFDDAGIRHGFATREGGVSVGSFASLNLARDLGDDPAAVAENHRRLAAAVGYERLFEVSQVHGTRIRLVEAGEDPREIRREEADALVARGPGVAVGVRTADCVPLLLAERRAGLVAAVHCGWRGVAAELAPKVVQRLVALGARRDAMIAALGPHIRRGRFEVGPEVVAPLLAAARGDESVVDRAGVRPHVDLAAILCGQLRDAGLEHIEDTGGCTFDDTARFFSHRRDAGRTGRHLSVVVG